MSKKLIFLLLLVLAYGLEESSDDESANFTCPMLQEEIDAQELPGFNNSTDIALLQTTRSCHDELLGAMQKLKEEFAELKLQLENASSQAERYKDEAENWKSLLQVELNKTIAKPDSELAKSASNDSSILWEGWQWIPGHNDTSALIFTLSSRVGTGLICDLISDYFEDRAPIWVGRAKIFKMVWLIVGLGGEVFFGFTKDVFSVVLGLAIASWAAVESWRLHEGLRDVCRRGLHIVLAALRELARICRRRPANRPRWP
ncbi:unnamed protein product, partial [Mesorhabditis spiculigera]